ncbi:MAG: hypothetical protein D6748_13355 [Calditrichaeota bacterium]|nr:MAG: hypothetical protein D6748_13355 [Calditrichota bacterium]
MMGYWTGKIFCLILLIGHFLFAQQGSIHGKVVNENREPLIGANVYLQGTVLGSATDENGEFYIEDVPQGEFVLNVSMIGYKPFSRRVIVKEASIEVGVIELSPTALAGEPVVVTAGKYEQKIQDVPVSLSTVNAEEITYRNNITLNQALQYVPGVNMNSSQVNIRGSSGYSRGVGSRVLLLMDGIPFLTGDTREINFDIIPIYMIERVEVLKGAGSALYGSSALGGVINVITRKINDTPFYYAKLYGGVYSEPSFESWRWSDRRRYLNGQTFSYSRKWGNIGVMVGGARDEDDSYRQNSWRRRWRGSGKLQWDISPFQQLTLSGSYMFQKRGNFLYWKDVNHPLVPASGQEDDWVQSRRFYLTAHYRYVFTPHQFLTVRGIWFHNRFEDNVAEGGGNVSTSRNFDGEVQYNVQIGSWFWTGGIEATLNSANSNIFGDHQGKNGAGYLQVEIPLNSHLRATLGGRFDYFDMDSVKSDHQLNPKLGLVWKPMNGTALRASMGWAFRAPSPGEVFITTSAEGFKLIPNYELKPERSRYLEIGVNRFFGKNVYLDIAGFYSRFEDLIEADFLPHGQGEIQFQNITRARIMGVETSLNGTFFRRSLQINLGHTYVDPRDLVKNDFLNFRPRHLFYGSLQWSKFFYQIGVDYRYIRRYDRIDEKLAIVVKDAQERVDAHVLDLRFATQFLLGRLPFRISLQINNVLRYNYVDLVGSLAPLRNFVITLESGG